ncbi:hypothetical protein PAXRUDRAFT_835021 [Paxillus rubicundulus Ve08.2h10]|uniref:Uncharacterized protein n=1 Tax=Paxillus rubicundulus Ve08.2h10 TaxID=930991 RepID=A0A0D0D194_9AGAM|nr:hypothetical protein PAXRUDRAFT_835021 [Paxillus rubicundulus Ve08.2h10]
MFMPVINRLTFFQLNASHVINVRQLRLTCTRESVSPHIRLGALGKIAGRLPVSGIYI